MKSIDKLLKRSKKLAGKTKVTLQFQLPMKKVRSNAKLLASLGASKVTIERSSKPAVKKAKLSASAKKAVKKTVKRKKSELKSTPKATVKKRTQAKTSTQKAPSKRRKTASVTQAAVLAALRAEHSTPQAIANAMKVNPVQVRSALSRYAQRGLIVRIRPGHYALKSPDN
ncbi:MAG: type IV toxin-antitoxin system AbiEi family antitoxin domain-containing protein [Pseudomonadales bacterium]